MAENALDGDYVGAPIVAPIVATASVTYAILDRTADDDYFVIDETTGQISVNMAGADLPLDYEVKPNYTVTVTATNAAGTSEAQVNIRLINPERTPDVYRRRRSNRDSHTR